MNKETKKLYTWLLKKPGYVKCSIEKILEKYPQEGNTTISIWFALKALKEARKTLKNAQVVKSNFKNEPKIQNFNIKNINKTKLRSIPGSYFITGCSHAPWHNKLMYDAVFRYLKSENITLQGLILAGDFLDLNSLSSHDRGKKAIEGVTLDWEYSETNKFLDQLDQLKFTKTATKDFLYGNHENRYLRLLAQSDESKYGTALQSPEEGLKLEKRGYNVYNDWKNDFISIGQHLNVGHGEICSTHVAKKMIDVYRKSMIQFHTHREQLYIEGNVGGFNMGSGADFDAPIFSYASWAMRNSWVNTSALVYLDKDGFFHVQSLRFMNGKLVINGKEY